MRLALILCLMFGGAAAARQEKPPPRAVDDDDKPHQCAYRQAIIDGAHQSTPGDRILTVVARAGGGDVRPDLNRRRLLNARAYLTEFLPPEHRRRSNKILLAVGEPVAGLGRLEFYAGGKTVGVIKVARNADVDFGNCYPPDDSYIRNHVYDPCRVKSHRIYYPCRDRRTTRAKRRARRSR